jgi:hypothetical protein
MSQASLQYVERLAMRLAPDERRRLTEDLLRSLETADKFDHPPRRLRGRWRGRFPEDFDIDSALREIRSG